MTGTAPASTAWELAIEVSNPSAAGSGIGPSVAVRVLPEGSIEIEPLAATGRHDDDLMPAIDRLAARCGLTPGALSSVMVSTGPGGYTGIRVSVVTAKMLSAVSGATLFAIPTATAVASAHAPREFPMLVCLASKQGTTYAHRFEGSGGAGTPIGVIGPNELSLQDLRTVIADQHLPDEIRQRIEEAGIAIVAPAFDARLLFRVSDRVNPVDAAALTPLYPRVPEAVRRWRAQRPA